jgi:hypothetical protein
MELKASFVEDLGRFSAMITALDTQDSMDRGKWLIKTIVKQNCDRNYMEELIKFFVSKGDLVETETLQDIVKNPICVVENEKGQKHFILELYQEKSKSWSYGYLQRLIYYLDNLKIKSAAFYRHIFDVCEYLVKKERRRSIWTSVGMVGISLLPLALIFILPLFFYPKGEPVVESSE